MNRKRIGVTKPLQLRYKSNEQKASTMEESRTLRALKKKEEQKINREKSLSRFRGMLTPQLKEECQEMMHQSSTKKYSKEELKELGRLRYLNMLKWKEQRRKLLEKEKMKRLPHFKTGVYQPEPPKFLCTVNDETNNSKITPWKYTTSTRKSTKKDPQSASIDWKVSRVAKPLRFHSGVTPQIIKSELERSLKGPVMRGRGRGTGDGSCPIRTSRIFRPPPGLGVSPLPITPSIYPKKSLKETLKKRKVESFAPQNFNFQPPEGVKTYALMREKPADANTRSQERDKDVIGETEEDLDLPVLDKTEEKCHQPVEGEREGDSTPHTHPLNVSFTQTEKCVVTEDEEANRASKDLPLMLSSSDDEGGSFASVEKSMKAHAGVTPGPSSVRKTRNKSFATPPLARLRPRTPCSRSTRRSKVAHCDLHEWGIEPISSTPRPSKNRGRKSVTIKLHLEDDSTTKTEGGGTKEEPSKEELFETPNEIKKVEASFTTPLSWIGGRNKGSGGEKLQDDPWITKLEASPWITKSRGSNSSAKERKRKSIFTNDLEALFNEIPLDGSLPVDVPEQVGLASPQLRKSLCPNDKGGSSSVKENTSTFVRGQTELMSLALPSGTVPGTPDFGVWGNDSAPDSLHAPEKAQKRSSEAILSVKEERKPLAEISPFLTAFNAQSKKRSVCFAPEEGVGEASSSIKFPVTPVSRRSTRFSMGLYAKSRSSPSISVVEELIHFDSPFLPETNSKRITRHRVSLLPGLGPCGEEETPTKHLIEGKETDLISWDSPVGKRTPMKRNSRKSHVNTPVRRSTRLSKSLVSSRN